MTRERIINRIIHTAMKRIEMPTTRRITLLAQSIVLHWCVAQAAYASTASETAPPPSGSLSYEIGAGAGLTLRNFTGSITLPFYPPLQLHHTGKGTVTGSFTVDGVKTEALSGTISTSGSNLKVRLSSTQAFPEFRFDQGDSVMRQDTFALVFDPGTAILSGTDRILERQDVTIYTSPGSVWEGDHMKIEHRRYLRSLPVSVPTAEITGGAWTLHLDILPTGNKLTGTARITFPNTETFQFQLFGSYLPKSRTAKVILRGTGEDKGAALTLSLVGPTPDLKSLRGIVGGQGIHYP